MKELFLQKMYGEYQAYKASALSCPNAEIFNRCHEIDAITNFYEILAEKADELSDDTLKALLPRRYILTELYDLWLQKKDSSYMEMKKHVEDEIEMFMEGYREGDTDGKTHQ